MATDQQRIHDPDARDRPVVVIVGGGMGGLSAAKALRHAPVHVLVIDRTNHNLFQPLLEPKAEGATRAAQLQAKANS